MCVCLYMHYQNALEEALTWFNGTRRSEFEQGEHAWWRDLVAPNRTATGAHFTRFTGTKVQALAQKALLRAASTAAVNSLYTRFTGNTKSTSTDAA